MLPVSSKYKEYVYTTEYARHFIPEVILKIIDLFARQCCSYTASSMIPFSSRAQLIDDVFGYGSGCFGTCEYNQFILDGMHDTFSKQQATEGSVNAQVGFMGEVMSNSACLFDPVLTLTCLYSQTIETVGRAIFFNETEASFPVDFDIAYYNNDNLLKTIQVRGNTDFVYNSVEGVTGYNKIIYTFMKTALPYSRVKIVEDIPGLYIQYTEGDVVSMNYTFSVDLFSLELLTGEIDVTLKNEEKIFNILNSEGIESYLARRQPLEFFVTMVFPDGTKERIRLGTLFITKWQTKSSTLEAQFTARDALDKLYQDDYKKGVYSTVLVSYYSLAEAILIDAGITDYSIDTALLNMYTYGIVPIVSHKEALRYIAQATCSVLLPTVDGSIKIKHIGVPASWYTSVDELDYSILYDSPDIYLEDAVKSIAVTQYTYTVAAEATEVYKETKKINGTLTFDAKFNNIVTECSITVSAGTVAESHFYANIATITITTTAETDVTITITGKVIDSTETVSTIDNTLEPKLVPDAKKVSIENPLVTTKGTADTLAAYSAYWYARRYRYAFDWRQNPAVELLDPIKVHDDFEKNNTTLVYEQNIDFEGGTLSGSSKTLY